MQKLMPQLAGTLSHFSKRTLFLHAPRNFSRTGISRTLIQLRDATSYSHQKERGHQAKERIPFFSPKVQKEKGMGRVKPGKGKGLRNGKAGKGKQPIYYFRVFY